MHILHRPVELIFTFSSGILESQIPHKVYTFIVAVVVPPGLTRRISPLMHGASLRWIGTVNTAKKSGVRSVLIRRLGAIAGRMACVLAAALLACASSAHAQVIEEGGFPVKGGGVSGEPFSLSCPPRLYVDAGESVLLSCSATAAPEEGVRYEWESLSGDGFHLLSASDELSPLFTAPLSGAGSEYEYRLTAMSAGVYETARVTVVVGDVSGGSVQDRSKSPVSQEGCDSFGGFERGLEGCLPWEKAPPRDFFGDMPEDEEIVPWPSFPESPGAEDKEFAGSSGAGPFPQTPPYLECPSAVFLEELETGAIECHASDALGEEHLEYEWEPVGNTTRDYLDNPRLLPEDVPDPSVVAPEAPVYETLESFRSGETTFRYRYRLTATSRATGLSSHSEVEVYVSSSRPSVYCPLEVAVEEGETAQLDCEGVDPLSHRMDYDEDGASILWEWEGLWGTSTSLLDATDMPSPLFTAPAGSAGSQYHYIASMTSSASGVARTARRKVTVTVTGGTEVTVTEVEPATDGFPSPGNKHLLAFEVACNGILEKGYLYEVRAEGPDKVLDCEASGGPDGVEPTCAWTGSASDLAKLSATDICDPTFDVPFSIYPSQRLITYPYDLRASAGGATTQPLRVLVNVHARLHTQIYCTSTGTGAFNHVLSEGTNNFTIPCREVPGGPRNTHTWTAAPGTPINLLNPTNILTPTFTVPDDVSGHQTYVYIVTITNNFPGDPLRQQFTLTVLDLDPSLTCEDSDVDEGSSDIMLDCSVMPVPSGAAYSWEGRGSTSDTSLLTSGDDTLTPTFDVPGNVGADTHYDYTVTLSAPGINNVTADVRVTVRDTDPSVTCRDADVIEDADDFRLACSVVDAPSDAAYSWEGRGGTSGTSLLTGGTDTLTPTFSVPEIDALTRSEAVRTYEYRVTLSASGINAVTEDVTITVREKEVICWVDATSSLPLVVPLSVDEGAGDLELETCEGGITSPGGPPYTFEWTSPGSGSASQLLTATDRQTVSFKVPGDVPRETQYEINFKVFRASEPLNYASALFRITVKNLDPVECSDPSDSVYEGSPPFALNCTDTGVLSGVTWVWDPTDHLTNTGTVAPTFTPPEIDNPIEEFSYTVTARVNGTDMGASGVTVKVRDKPEITVTCTGNSYDPYEGSGELVLDCSASSSNLDLTYAYVWEARGSTVVPGKLSSTTIRNPTFDVPDSVDENGEKYEYTLTASAENAVDGVLDVTVTVLNKPEITVTCTGKPDEAYEGDDDIVLDCSASGAPSGSTYNYAWTARGSTVVPGKLSSTTIRNPTFDVPDSVDENGETYEYTLTASAENSVDGVLDVTVTVLNKPEITVTCTGNPYDPYEGEDDFNLDCSATGAPSGSTYNYAWTGRGSTVVPGKLSSATIRNPTFDVPDTVDANETYEYTLTASAENSVDGVLDVTVRVLNKEPLTLICTPPTPVYEGAADFDLDCSASGAPSGSDYVYEWTARGGGDTDKLSSTTIAKPTFDVPDNVDADTDYEYLLTVSAENAADGVLDVTVQVLNKKPLTPICTPVAPVYEGAADFDLDCSASGAPSGSDYVYEWTARGGGDTDKLSSTTIAKPTFDVPDNVDADTDYEYLLTVSAENAESATEDVTVTVLNKRTLDVVCATPSPVYEGSEDFALDCAATGAPAGSDYAYVWTARGTTSNTDLLVSGTDGPTPTFDVPEEVDEDKTYEYLLTVSAENAIDATAEVAVKVLNLGSIALICASPPLVYEGSEDFVLDCSISGDTGDTDYTYEWTARGATANTDLLSATDSSTPTFAVPDQLDRATTYEYLLTARAENAEDATAEVAVTVLNRGTLAVACAPPPLVYEGSEDFALDCTASGAPVGSDYVYVWTGRGSTVNTDLLVSGTDGPTPTFAVPDQLDAATTYEYLLTVSAENAESGSAAVTVTVLNRGALSVVCVDPPSVYEGSTNFALDCSASGAPAGSEYAYVWTARGSTANAALLIAGTDGPTPTFDVPEQLDAATTYEYLLTVSAENAESGSAEVTVTVLNAGALRVVCASPPPVYEGSADFALDCSASGAPAGSEYAYAWTARGSTANTALLIAGTDGPTPTFAVPDALDAATTYEYLLTVSAENAESGSAAVTVTVLNRGALSVVCADPPSIYEGSEDFDLDCSASGAPAGSEYAYVWTARGSTANTALLSRADIPTPTFYVPDALEAATTYEYLLTVSADNVEDRAAAVTVTVLNRAVLSVVCADPPSIYEGSEDFALDCSASGAPAGSEYAYAWAARGSTANTALLSRADIPSPTFYVPDALEAATTYEYLLTVSARNAESGSAAVTVTVLDHGPLSVVCADPPSIYEGSEDFALDCSASGAPAGSEYAYAWAARGSTANTALLSRADIPSPTFYVPDEVDRATTYEYLLTASADNVEDAMAEVTVTVLNRGALSVVCMDPGSVYEGSEDITLDCSASGAPAGSGYAYVWMAQGDTQNTLQLSATDIPSPTFYVPDAVDETTDYEYLLTVSTENAADASAEVVVTVLNKETLAVVCMDPGSAYEGSEDFAFNCTASGAPGGSEYTYVWMARDSTANTDLLSRADISSPTFYVPDDVDTTTTYKYLLTASADNAEDASAEVMVTVLDRAPLAFVDDSISGRVYVFTVGETIADILLSEATGGLLPYTHILTPLLSRGLSLKIAGDSTWTISGTPLEVSPRTEYAWQIVDANTESVSLTFFIEVIPAAEPSRPVAEPSSELPEPSSLGVTVSASSLRLGVQSAQTQVSLDPMTDQISTRVSGPYHAGRMTLSPDGGEETPENGEMNLSIELASPVVLRREGGVEAASIVLAPIWSLAESCEQLSSQAIGGLYTEVTLSEDACRLLRFGGELDLTDVLSGRYAGSLDIILRSGENEETHSVEVDVTVIPAQQVITIGPGGVRFSTSRELPAGLTEEQNMSIYPHVAFLTEEKPHGVFELSNPSLIPLEISVSARFGYTEATENGREVVVEDASGSHLGDLSSVVDIHPGVLVLQPGEKGLVRYGVKEDALAAMSERGYAAFFDVVSSPRQYVRSDQMPEEVTGDRTARVTMRIPGVYVPGEGASQLRAALLSISYVGSLSATFLLETQDHPFMGEVLAYDGEGRELGRRETLVYTRSRVRIPLDRVPEGSAVFLRFAPRGPGRVPLPASVEWDAPRRDIGAAGNKGRTTISQPLVQKP